MRAAGLLGVMLLIQAGCHKPVPTRDVPVESERIELRVAAPGMDPAQVEAEIVKPVEAAVLSTPGLRHVTAEAGEAHARLWLEVDAAQRDAVLTDVRAR